MKKLIPMLLSFCLAVTLLAGCGPKNAENNPTVPSSESGSISTPISTSPTPPEPDSSKPLPSGTLAVNEQVLVDQDGVKVTLTGVSSGSREIDFDLTLENTTDLELTVYLSTCSVNGYMVDAYGYFDLAPASTTEDVFSFYKEDLVEAGVTGNIGVIQTRFSVHDEDYNSMFTTDIITIETSFASEATPPVLPQGDVLYDENNLTIVYHGIEKKSSYTNVMLSIANNTADDVTIQARDEKVNGKSDISGIMSTDIMPGTIAKTYVSFSDSSLEESGITEITALELSFHLFNWDTDYRADTPVITFPV